MEKERQRHNELGYSQLTSEQTCSRRRSIAATAPAASPANAAKAAVHIRPLAGGEVAIFRETPRQRLKRLQRLRAIYIQHGSKAFNAAVREEAEKLAERTKIVFVLVSARVRALLRRKRLLERAGLSLSGTGNLGIVNRSSNFNDRRSLIPTQDFVREVVIRAPPTKNTLLLSRQFAVSPASVWFGFVSPRVVRAPAFLAARLGGSGVMTSNCSAV